MTTTLHIVFHAHLDPVWMWPWTAGLDEVIGTSRSACDRLDAHPRLTYAQGEAWSFAMVERADPQLFRRIQAHVASGRWEIVNGWWTQPDCNFPSIDGLHRQLTTGLSYVRDRFGITPRCGFNPDSFGHAAILPEVMRAHGQDRYVFMRPQPHECALPARLFRWRSRSGGPAVAALRIAESYGNGIGGVNIDLLRRACEDLPAASGSGNGHALALAGLGNHGGGPTERLVRWFEENSEVIPGVRMEFSTIGRYFDAVEHDTLPEVVGELQMHAVGCYSVARGVKTGIRRAEHMLARAEEASACTAPELEQAWRAVCAHHFHDTLGGTLVADAFPAVEDQLASARAVADEGLGYAVRAQVAQLPNDPLPRLVLANPGAKPYRGWCEASVYLEGPWQKAWGLRDDAGISVPFQEVHNDVGIDPGWFWGLRRVLVHAEIPAGGLRVLRMDPTAINPALKGNTVPHPDPWPGVDLGLAADPTDTWSHDVDRYGAITERVVWGVPRIIDRGPLMSSQQCDGTLGDSTVRAEWRRYANDDAVDLVLDVHWRARHQVLKLLLPVTGEHRIDGTPGMGVERANSGREVPLQDWTRFANVAVACPDAYAIDVHNGLARFTLLRSPLLAHHAPAKADFPRGVVADQGVHRFRFRFRSAHGRVEDDALAWHRPPLVAECTRGMPLRMLEG